MPANARIVLIHALPDSQKPAWSAFAAHWPEAEVHNLLDDSLATDLAAEGGLRPAMMERFLTLGRYAAAAGTKDRGTDGILFTCSAFGRAIDAVKAAVAIPVLKPNEAAFEAALECGTRIGLLVTFAPAIPPMEEELRTMARERGIDLQFSGRVAEGALAALQAGDTATHDRLIAATAAAMPPLDALVIGQFSAARAAAAIAPVAGRRVFTTPEAAVAKLKRLVTAG
jgi:maleate cis-trans isomerase